jgi:hypothetical protein
VECSGGHKENDLEVELEVTADTGLFTWPEGRLDRTRVDGQFE